VTIHGGAFGQGIGRYRGWWEKLQGIVGLGYIPPSFIRNRCHQQERAPPMTMSVAPISGSLPTSIGNSFVQKDTAPIPLISHRFGRDTLQFSIQDNKLFAWTFSEGQTPRSAIVRGLGAFRLGQRIAPDAVPDVVTRLTEILTNSRLSVMGPIVEISPRVLGGGPCFSRPSPLANAIEAGDLTTVKQLIENEGVSIDDLIRFRGEKLPPLYIALYQKQTECAKYLIERGADVYPSISMRPEECVGIHNGMSAIQIAACQGMTEICELLVNSGKAPVDQVEKGQFSAIHCLKTPLYYAALHGRIATMTALLSLGADAAKKETYDTLFRQLIAGIGDPHPFAPEIHPGLAVDVVKTLLDAGADLHGGSTRESALISAFKDNRLYVTLNERRRKDRQDPVFLMPASFEVSKGLVQFLLDRGAKIDLVYKDFWSSTENNTILDVAMRISSSPKHYTIGNPWTSIVASLYRAGATCNYRHQINAENRECVQYLENPPQDDQQAHNAARARLYPQLVQTKSIQQASIASRVVSPTSHTPVDTGPLNVATPQKTADRVMKLLKQALPTLSNPEKEALSRQIKSELVGIPLITTSGLADHKIIEQINALADVLVDEIKIEIEEGRLPANVIKNKALSYVGQLSAAAAEKSMLESRLASLEMKTITNPMQIAAPTSNQGKKDSLVKEFGKGAANQTGKNAADLMFGAVFG
jgi:hypothetical protein